MERKESSYKPLIDLPLPPLHSLTSTFNEDITAFEFNCKFMTTSCRMYFTFSSILILTYRDKLYELFVNGFHFIEFEVDNLPCFFWPMSSLFLFNLIFFSYLITSIHDFFKNHIDYSYVNSFPSLLKAKSFLFTTSCLLTDVFDSIFTFFCDPREKDFRLSVLFSSFVFFIHALIYYRRFFLEFSFVSNNDNFTGLYPTLLYPTFNSRFNSQFSLGFIGIQFPYYFVLSLYSFTQRILIVIFFSLNRGEIESYFLFLLFGLGLDFVNIIFSSCESAFNLIPVYCCFGRRAPRVNFYLFSGPFLQSLTWFLTYFYWHDSIVPPRPPFIPFSVYQLVCSSDMIGVSCGLKYLNGSVASNQTSIVYSLFDQNPVISSQNNSGLINETVFFPVNFLHAFQVNIFAQSLANPSLINISIIDQPFNLNNTITSVYRFDCIHQLLSSIQMMVRCVPVNVSGSAINFEYHYSMVSVDPIWPSVSGNRSSSQSIEAIFDAKFNHSDLNISFLVSLINLPDQYNLTLIGASQTLYSAFPSPLLSLLVEPLGRIDLSYYVGIHGHYTGPSLEGNPLIHTNVSTNSLEIKCITDIELNVENIIDPKGFQFPACVFLDASIAQVDLMFTTSDYLSLSPDHATVQISWDDTFPTGFNDLLIADDLAVSQLEPSLFSRSEKPNKVPLLSDSSIQSKDNDFFDQFSLAFIPLFLMLLVYFFKRIVTYSAKDMSFGS